MRESSSEGVEGWMAPQAVGPSVSVTLKVLVVKPGGNLSSVSKAFPFVSHTRCFLQVQVEGLGCWRSSQLRMSLPSSGWRLPHIALLLSSQNRKSGPSVGEMMTLAPLSINTFCCYSVSVCEFAKGLQSHHDLPTKLPLQIAPPPIC